MCTWPKTTGMSATELPCKNGINRLRESHDVFHHDELVLHVNGGAALDDEVKHVHVAEDHGDVGDRVAGQKRN